MSLVLDSPEKVSVEVSRYHISDFSVNTDDKIATVDYKKGVLDSDGNFIAAAANRLSISGSNYDTVIQDAEQIQDNENLGVYASVKKALYNYIADYEGVSGTVE